MMYREINRLSLLRLGMSEEFIAGVEAAADAEIAGGLDVSIPDGQAEAMIQKLMREHARVLGMSAQELAEFERAFAADARAMLEKN